MRIIGGQWRGRRIQIPSKKWPVRPTTDFAREALFNILDNRFDYPNASALDLFGGTGMHCLELASRGCQDITYVDRYRQSCVFMQTLAREMDLPIKVVRMDVLKFVEKTEIQWDYIFADPPYDMSDIELLPKKVLQTGMLKAKGFFILEHRVQKSFDQTEGFQEARQYGQSVFSFFAAGS